MQNFDFDKQAQAFALQLLGGLSALAPVLIILSMLAAFCWLGFMDYLYFKEALPSPALALLAAAFLQGMRFGTALGGVRLFRAGKISGVLFLIASFTLTYLESSHVVAQAAALATTPAGEAASIWLIKIAVWASVGLEVLVAVLFSAMYSEAKGAQATSPGEPSGAPQGKKPQGEAPTQQAEGKLPQELLEALQSPNGKTAAAPL